MTVKKQNQAKNIENYYVIVSLCKPKKKYQLTPTWQCKIRRVFMYNMSLNTETLEIALTVKCKIYKQKLDVSFYVV